MAWICDKDNISIEYNYLFHQEVVATIHVSLLINNICLWFQKLFCARTHPSFIYFHYFLESKYI
jgi:hypothetical protein